MTEQGCDHLVLVAKQLLRATDEHRLKIEGVPMNIPGFTAEASLAKGNTLYRTTGEAPLDSASLRPAQSETIDPNHVALGLVHHPGVGNCLKKVCPLIRTPFGDIIRSPWCHWVVGWC
jgi:hypothetical protein